MKTVEGKTILFDVEPSESVLCVKRRLASSHGVDFDRCVFFICGKIMANLDSICDYNIQTESTIHVAYRKLEHISPPMKDIMISMNFVGILPLVWSIRYYMIKKIDSFFHVNRIHINPIY